MGDHNLFFVAQLHLPLTSDISPPSAQNLLKNLRNRAANKNLDFKWTTINSPQAGTHFAYIKNENGPNEPRDGYSWPLPPRVELVTLNDSEKIKVITYDNGTSQLKGGGFKKKIFQLQGYPEKLELVHYTNDNSPAPPRGSAPTSLGASRNMGVQNLQRMGSVATRPVEDDINRGNYFPCPDPECDKVCTRQSDLTKHINYHHPSLRYGAPPSSISREKDRDRDRDRESYSQRQNPSNSRTSISNRQQSSFNHNHHRMSTVYQRRKEPKKPEAAYIMFSKHWREDYEKDPTGKEKSSYEAWKMLSTEEKQVWFLKHDEKMNIFKKEYLNFHKTIELQSKLQAQSTIEYIHENCDENTPKMIASARYRRNHEFLNEIFSNTKKEIPTDDSGKKDPWNLEEHLEKFKKENEELTVKLQEGLSSKRRKCQQGSDLINKIKDCENIQELMMLQKQCDYPQSRRVYPLPPKDIDPTQPPHLIPL